ncbi:HAD hydrolase family protein, partial [Bacillus cereus]|uniref:HAD hydrolase family protein n=1 Tax=Bacillus cereus TaxID=1396 RepID=UPI0020C0C8FF
KLDTPIFTIDTANLYTPNRDISEYTVYESYITKVPLQFRTIDEVLKDILIPKVMFIDDPDKLEKAMASIPESFIETYTMVKSAPFFHEILHPKVSKGNSVKLLAEKLGIEQKVVMAIGDYGNDMSMNQWAGCGVAMANA